MPGVPQTANFVAGWLERAEFSSIGEGCFSGHHGLIERVIGRLRRAANFGTAGTRGASALIAGGWDVVVAGHSHMLAARAMYRRLYANTGSLCEGSAVTS